MTRYGYMRVSTKDKQEFTRQRKFLADADISEENIFSDKQSGKVVERKGLNSLLSVLKEGDSVTVTEFSRCSRSVKQLIELSELFREKGVDFISLKEKVDTTTAEGKLFYTIIAAFSEFEANIISDRTKQALAAAADEGRKGGRPKVNQEELERALYYYQNSNKSVSQISKATGISKSSIYREIEKRNIQRRDISE